MHPEALGGGVAAFDEAVRTGVCPYLSQLGEVALGEMRSVYEQLDAGNYEALGELAARLATAVEQKLTGGEVASTEVAETIDQVGQQVTTVAATRVDRHQEEQSVYPKVTAQALKLGRSLDQLYEQETINAYPPLVDRLPDTDQVRDAIMTRGHAAVQVVSRSTTIFRNVALNVETTATIGAIEEVVDIAHGVPTSEPKGESSTGDSLDVAAEQLGGQSVETEQEDVPYVALSGGMTGLPNLYSSERAGEELLESRVDQASGITASALFEELVVLDAQYDQQLPGVELTVLSGEVAMPASEMMLPEVLAPYTVEEVVPLEVIRAHVNEVPLEQVLAELAVYLEGATEEPEGVQIRAWLHELNELLRPSVLTTEARTARAPKLTVEILNRLLTLMLAIGYTRPQEALSEFVTSYGLEQLMDAFQYLCMLDAEAAQKEHAGRQVAAVNIGVDSTMARLRTFGRMLCYLVLAPTPVPTYYLS